MKGTVIVRYVDTEGNEIVPSETVANDVAVGTTYNTEQKVITGYSFKEMSSESAPATGNVVEGNQTVTYVYGKIGYYKLYVKLLGSGLWPIENESVYVSYKWKGQPVNEDILLLEKSGIVGESVDRSHIIDASTVLRDLTFVVNGVDYTADEFREFLRDKRKYSDLREGIVVLDTNSSYIDGTVIDYYTYTVMPMDYL